jgi:diguanylate cyclase (GGDEF)-like protein
MEPLRQALIERRDVRTVLKNFKKDGTPFWNELYLSPIRDRAGDVTHYVGIQNDVTERIELEAKVAHAAQHDALTGLPNRALLMDRLTQALARAKRNGRFVAVLFLDLDNLKTLNDDKGHDAGDLFLRVVGQRLASAIRNYETAARLGGDEFVVVLEDIQDEEGASQIKCRIATQVQQPIWISQEAIHPSASIGMALYPQDGQTPGELLRVADIAMYLAKSTSKQKGQATFNAECLQ